MPTAGAFRPTTAYWKVSLSVLVGPSEPGAWFRLKLPLSDGRQAILTREIAAESFARFDEREQAEAGRQFNAWITSQFLHGSLVHIGGNLLFVELSFVVLATYALYLLVRRWRRPGRSRGVHRRPMRSGPCTCAARTRSWRGIAREMSDYWIEPLADETDLEGVLEVESESFTNPWTRAMYAWELQNRSVCHIYVARTRECPVAGFCAFWLVLEEIHINNVAVRPQFRGAGIGSALLHYVLAEAKELGARRATLEVRASNVAARRLYERLGFYVAATRRNYYTNPVEDALILWRDESA